MITLDAEQIAEVRREFEKFDKDNNDRIDLDEFMHLMDDMAPSIEVEYLKGGFTLIDDNGDGLICFDEFLAWWQDADWEQHRE